MQFRTKQGQILDVTVKANGDVQMACEQAKFFGTFFPENAQAFKKFLNANLPEVVENPEINLKPNKDNAGDGDAEMENTHTETDSKDFEGDIEAANKGEEVANVQ